MVRCSPKRASVALPVPPEVRAEIARVLALPDMHPLTRVKEVAAVMPLPASVKGTFFSIFNDADRHTCEARSKSYGDLGRETMSSRRITIDRVALLEAVGLLRTTTTTIKGRPRWNGLNVFLAQIPPAWLDAVDGTAANDEVPPPSSARPSAPASQPSALRLAPPTDLSPEERAILEILVLHADALPDVDCGFARELWKFARKGKRYGLRRVVTGLEHAVDKRDELRGRDWRNFCKACIKQLRDGEAPSPEARAVLRRAEEQLEANRAAATAPFTAPPPVAPAPAAPVPSAPRPTAPELLAFLATPRSPEAVQARWPGLTSELVFLHFKGHVHLVDGAWTLTPEGREHLASLATGPP